MTHGAFTLKMNALQLQVSIERDRLIRAGMARLLGHPVTTADIPSVEGRLRMDTAGGAETYYLDGRPFCIWAWCSWCDAKKPAASC